ncbi:MAG: ABC transporter ATP-binding protein [Desulfobacterales bacterium]|nr:ABC transporter ATP-binding protein [Desulfobacterales bacterium]
MASFRIENITKAFGKFTALNQVSTELDEDLISAIIGPNGAGKTTLVNVCTGMFPPDSGGLFFDSRNVTKQPSHKRVQLGIARTFQIVNIFPELTVRENIRVPLLYARHKTEVEEAADALLDTYGLARFRDTRAVNISHGDQKLLEMAMAIAVAPKVLFLDEPTAGVGMEEKEKIIETVQRFKGKNMITAIIEHDMETVFRIADRIIVMNEGEVIAQGSPEEIKSNAFVRKIYLKEEV